MSYELVINGTLPNLNEYISKLNVSKFRGAELKRETEKIISAHIRKQLRGVKFTEPVFIKYAWHEPNRKRDLDNIAAFGMKCIQDALVKCGVIENDGWSNIAGFSHDFFIDESNPRIEVVLREALPF